MKCSCGADTIVKDSRNTPEGRWRRRYCNACGVTYTTLEQICETLPAKRGKPSDTKPKAEAQKITLGTIKRNASARSRIEDMKMLKAMEEDL